MKIKARKKEISFRKVSEETIKNILDAIKKGGTRRHAAEANGVSERHFYSLIEQGKIDLEVGNLDSLCAKLAQSLRLIELHEIQECRGQIKLTPNGAQWTLEKVYWRDFGQNAEAKEIAKEIEMIKGRLKGFNHEIDSQKSQENSNE